MPSTVATIHGARPAMGTLFEALLVGDDEEHLTAVAEAVLDEIVRIERLLSRFDPRSEISRINRLAAREEVLVDQEMAALLALCIDSWHWTGGAFDVTAGTGRNSDKAFPEGPIRGNSPFVPCQVPGVKLDRARRHIRLASFDVQIDLGGVGKGYALDRAATVLDENRIEHALLHGGTSSVLARGCDVHQEPWRIMLRNPLASEDAGLVRLKNEALSCSAVSEQGDIIDPASGKPLVGPAAVAVVSPTATEAEVLSTALLCLGRKKGDRFVLQNCGLATTAIWL